MRRIAGNDFDFFFLKIKGNIEKLALNELKSKANYHTGR